MTLMLEIVGPQTKQLGTAVRKEFACTGGSIGRAADNDWMIPDPYISGHHARIHFRDGRYFLEDTSTNGVYLKHGGTRLRKGHLHALQSGEQICLDQLEVRVYVSQPAAEPTLVKPAPEAHHTPMRWLSSEPQRHETDDATALMPPGLLFQTPPQASASKAPPNRTQTPANARPNAEATSTAVLREPARPSSKPKPVKTTMASRPEAAGSSSSVKAKPASEPSQTRFAAKIGFYDPPDHAFVPANTPTKSGAPPANRVEDKASGTKSDPANPAAFDVEALLAEAGIPLSAASPELARTLGKIVRTAVAGMIDVLREREEAKEALRLELTLFKHAENNPLKFSANVDDAMHNLFVKQNPAYLGAHAAFVQGFRDVHQHHAALRGALLASFEAVLRKLDPDHLQAQFDQAAGKAKSSFLTHGRYWKLFRAHYRQTIGEAGRIDGRLFTEEFSRAYHEQIEAMRTR